MAQFEAAAVVRTLPHYKTDHAETSEPVVIIVSRTPLPAVAAVVLGTITSDLAIVAAVPFGVVADVISGLPSPIFPITKLAEPALWRAALFRAIGSFGRSRVHNR